jgi:hypothetical protein
VGKQNYQPAKVNSLNLRFQDQELTYKHEELRIDRAQGLVQNKDLHGNKPEFHKFFQTQKINFEGSNKQADSLYNSKDQLQEKSSDSLKDGSAHQASQGS